MIRFERTEHKLTNSVNICKERNEWDKKAMILKRKLSEFFEIHNFRQKGEKWQKYTSLKKYDTFQTCFEAQNF